MLDVLTLILMIHHSNMLYMLCMPACGACHAGMDILCSDKTGTLTLNKLTVEQASVQPFGNFSREDVLKYAALSAQRNSEEAIDVVRTVANLLDLSDVLVFYVFMHACMCFITSAEAIYSYLFLKAFLASSTLPSAC